VSTAHGRRYSRSQRLDYIAVSLWLTAILFMFIGGFIYNGAWLLSLILWGVGAWFVHLSHGNVS